MSTQITCGIKLIITHTFLLTINSECNIVFSVQNCECNDLQKHGPPK